MDFPYLLFGSSLLLEGILLAAIAVRFRFSGENIRKSCDTLDGLRGFLAMIVFISHSVTSYFYWGDNVWRYPDYRLYTYFGQAGVAVFFMITGYLFIGKILADDQVSWRSLYVNRIFRIGPLYIFAASLVLFMAFLAKDFRLNVQISEFLISLLKLYSLGMFGVPEINGNEKTWIFIAGTPWTLQYEWAFYFLLPVSWYVLNRLGKVFFLIMILLSLLVVLNINTNSGFINKHISIFSYFSMGALAVFCQKSSALKRFCSTYFSSLAVVSILGVLGGFYSDAVGVPQALLLGTAFVLIVSGCDFFGLLRLASMRMLGEISYSIYLLHGCVLYLVMFTLYKPAMQFGITGYWLLSLAVVFLVFVVSILTYRIIEIPGQRVGRALVAKLFSPINFVPKPNNA